MHTRLGVLVRLVQLTNLHADVAAHIEIGVLAGEVAKQRVDGLLVCPHALLYGVVAWGQGGRESSGAHQYDDPRHA